jgi:hypothetical protein
MVKKKRFDQARLKSMIFDDICIFINTLKNSWIIRIGHSLLRIFLGVDKQIFPVLFKSNVRLKNIRSPHAKIQEP